MKSIRLSKSMFLMIFLFFTLHIGLDTALAQDQASKYPLKSDYEGGVFYSKFDYRGLRVNFPLNFKKSWLRASPIFDGVLFDSLITFKKAVFEDQAHFRQVRFGGFADFSHIRFEAQADFRQSIFQEDGLFWFSEFRSQARFDSVYFQKAAVFASCVFDQALSCREAVFDTLAYFQEIKSGLCLDASGAVFRGVADFQSANFVGDAIFRDCIFEQALDFSKASLDKKLDLSNCRIEGDALFFDCTLPDTLLLQGAEAFLEIDFRWIIPRDNPCMICLDASSAGFVCLPYEYFQLFFPLELSREDKINIYRQLIETASKKCSSQALEKLENELSAL